MPMKFRTRESEELVSIDDLYDGLIGVSYDPHSTIISKSVTFGNGNVFYPNVVIRCDEGGTILVGDRNIFYPGTLIICEGGALSIGNNNSFGEGGIVVRLNRSGVRIGIGDDTRLLHGVAIYGNTIIGNGCQIIGKIVVDSCTLEGGESFKDENPDLRGAVLKGLGVAKGIVLSKGEVVDGLGDFGAAPIRRQIEFHPRPAK